ncbi:MAG: hypothetical protein AAFW95_09550, partial [Cyanobacteria bacterium J06638_6]
MASTHSSALGVRQIQQALLRAAKDTLVASGIQPTTRRGNKELDLAVQRLAQQPYSTLAEATQAGQALGQKITEISQAQGKINLDGGIVRQMMLTGVIPTVPKAAATKPAKSAPMVMSEPQSSVPSPAVDPEVEAIAADSPEIEAIAQAATVADVPAMEAMETVDPAVADAPAMAEIEILDPAAIAPPETEPLA